MKAIGYNQAGPITAPDALIEFETGTPELRPHDLLVDVKVRACYTQSIQIRAFIHGAVDPPSLFR